MSNTNLTPCVYCGHLVSPQSDRCPACDKANCAGEACSLCNKRLPRETMLYHTRVVDRGSSQECRIPTIYCRTCVSTRTTPMADWLCPDCGELILPIPLTNVFPDIEALKCVKCGFIHRLNTPTNNSSEANQAIAAGGGCVGCVCGTIVVMVMIFGVCAAWFENSDWYGYQDELTLGKTLVLLLTSLGWGYGWLHLWPRLRNVRRGEEEDIFLLIWILGWPSWVLFLLFLIWAS